eukprot:GHVS01064995.1.p1 GENE.GHVS01064995.1~~GHVS01064995.1.p1  ORF type:complete len:383 (-),score=60.39 GHVS01064995.1:180-1328(-)
MARRDRVLLLAALLHLFCPASVSGFTLTTTSRLTNRPSSLPSTGLSQCLRPAAAEAAAASASTAPAGVKRQTVQMSFPVDLHGKVAFVAGVADSSGYGWAVAKNLASAGAKIVLGTWPPVLGIFKKSLESGRLDEDMKLPDGSKMKIEKIYALDAVYDTPDDVPEDVKKNKRYSAGGVGPFTLSEVASEVKKDFGKVDILVHSLANGPEVTKPLLETSRKGYLAAISASSYSMVSMLQRFGPIMSPGGAAVSLTYIASERVIPGYGGGMSSAKSALESDTRTLAWEAGRKFGVRVNTISAGPLKSRAATAIGKDGDKSFIDYAIDYSKANSPLPQHLYSDDIGSSALFLLSPMARAVTGVTLYVDNGLHAMGQAVDAASLAK